MDRGRDRYGVMQSDGNSFCVYVVLVRSNKASRDEDNILNKYIKANMFGFFLWWLITLFENGYYHNSRTEIQFYEFLVVMACISFDIHFPYSLLIFKIFKVKLSKYLLFIFLVLNAFFICLCHVKAVQDDISAKTVPIWLHQTVEKIEVCREGYRDY